VEGTRVQLNAILPEEAQQAWGVCGQLVALQLKMSKQPLVPASFIAVPEAAPAGGLAVHVELSGAGL
jgi:hypothetical protein